LTTSFEPVDQREVELRAQSGENSQLFMESQFTNAAMMGRFNNAEDFGPGEFEDDREIGFAGINGGAGQQHKITVNLEDAVLEE